MVADIFSTVTTCKTCARDRLALRRHTSPLTLFPAKEPLTEVSIDIIGSSVASITGNRFVPVMTDRFSEAIPCVAMRKITAILVESAAIDAWVS